VAAPTSLAATVVSGTQIDLTWTDSSANEVGFQIERSINGGSFNPLATVDANVGSYHDSGLSMATTYTYRVRAFNGSGVSDYSNTAAGTTPAPPAAPTSLAAGVASASQINLSWTDNSSNEEEFQIERSLDGISFGLIATVGANQTSYADSGLTTGTTYSYRIRASNSVGDSDPTNVASATTAAVPAPPSNLSGIAVSDSQIYLTWTDNASNESGFRVYRSTNGTSFTLIKTLGANVTSYSYTGRPASTRYFFRVRAYNATGESLSSNTVSVTTLPPQPAPNAPGDLTATTVSSSVLALTWTDNSSAEDGFKIYRSTDGATFTLIKTVGWNVTSYADTGRVAATTYLYRVRAYSRAGESPDSNTASATTLPPQPKPNAPTNLTATAMSSTQINLTWMDNATNEDSFRVYRSTDGVTFTQIAKVGWNVTTYLDTTCAPAMRYYYRVRAYNATGGSAYSTTASATTPSGSEAVLVQ
jgi:fibronectin type 3 domain-containing protein